MHAAVRAGGGGRGLLLEAVPVGGRRSCEGCLHVRRACVETTREKWVSLGS